MQLTVRAVSKLLPVDLPGRFARPPHRCALRFQPGRISGMGNRVLRHPTAALF